jgi:hypothetical protein
MFDSIALLYNAQQYLIDRNRITRVRFSRKGQLMDSSRFDGLTKSLAGGRSRRSLLGAALGAAAASFGLHGASAAARCRNGGAVCSKNADCCSSLCGAKDRTGRRVCAAPIPPCRSDQDCPPDPNSCRPPFCLEGTCTSYGPPDFQNDPSNCGGCDINCPFGDNATGVCTNGQCSIACEQGFVYCSGDSCADLQSDSSNCGSCGFGCEGITACSAGQCIDTSSDPNNCGAVGYICRIGETCVGGACQCGENSRCEARKACIGGSCIDNCEPGNGATLCQADCGTIFATCFAGPEDAFCEAGGASVGDFPCDRDAQCADFNDAQLGYSGRCIARGYGAAITDYAGPAHGTCLQVQTAICPHSV